MEKKNYLRPVTKKLSLDISSALCTEPVIYTSVPETIYAGPDIEQSMF